MAENKNLIIRIIDSSIDITWPGAVTLVGVSFAIAFTIAFAIAFILLF